MDQISRDQVMRLLKIYIIYLILLSFVLAQDYASFAGSFLRMGSSARSMGMGSAFTAEIDEGFAAYHNPASMVFLGIVLGWIKLMGGIVQVSILNIYQLLRMQ